jgi:hypothetical protein
MGEGQITPDRGVELGPAPHSTAVVVVSEPTWVCRVDGLARLHAVVRRGAPE